MPISVSRVFVFLTHSAPFYRFLNNHRPSLLVAALQRLHILCNLEWIIISHTPAYTPVSNCVSSGLAELHIFGVWNVQGALLVVLTHEHIMFAVLDGLYLVGGTLHIVIVIYFLSYTVLFAAHVLFLGAGVVNGV